MEEIKKSYRVEYVDALKGFAILCVVIGHTITKLYDAPFTTMLFDYPFVTMFWWRVIYSFHMPLFMFISGYLFCKNEGYTLLVALKTLWKRTYTLLLPFLSWLLITKYVFNAQWELWFLRSLLTFIIITISWELLRIRIPNKYIAVICDLIFYAGSWYVLKHGVRFLPVEWQQVLDFRSDMYLFFCFGILYKRYQLERLLNHRWCFSVVLIVYLLLFYMSINGYTDIIPYHSIILPLCGVLTIWYLFMVNSKVLKNVNGGGFARIGIYTLEIYVVHTLVSFHLPWIGDIIINLSQSNDISQIFSASTIQIVVSIVLSLITIEMSLIIRKIISHSRILSLLLLGKIYK